MLQLRQVQSRYNTGTGLTSFDAGARIQTKLRFKHGITSHDFGYKREYLAEHLGTWTIFRLTIRYMWLVSRITRLPRPK